MNSASGFQQGAREVQKKVLSVWSGHYYPVKIFLENHRIRIAKYDPGINAITSGIRSEKAARSRIIIKPYYFYFLFFTDRYQERSYSAE